MSITHTCIQLLADHHRVSVSDIMGGDHGFAAIRHRVFAMAYELGATQTGLAELFNRSRTVVQKGIERDEWRRSRDPEAETWFRQRVLELRHARKEAA